LGSEKCLAIIVFTELFETCKIRAEQKYTLYQKHWSSREVMLFTFLVAKCTILIVKYLFLLF